ncbi:MAG: ABC transporter substrate-binding protein [Proteobacteria bacterium]|nr:ABC transporter substrate-binding protein [Pseudomonadota bacterium]
MKKLTGILLCLICGQAVIAAELGPEQLIRQTSERVLMQIKANPEQYEEDPAKLYALVSEVVLPHFNFEKMTELALGRHKAKISQEQKPQIVKEFRTLLVRTYGNALLEYNDQKIIYLPMAPSSKEGYATVKTEIDQAGGFPIPLDYKLQLEDDGWKVYDISVDEVSLVTNYRSSFSRQIRKYGVDGLIKTLRESNREE